jgi:hypothetical protein
MKFIVISNGMNLPCRGKNTAYLRIDYWNDYSYVTMFYLTIHDEKGNYHEIGNVKIGFKGQVEDVSTYSTMDNEFEELSDQYFSLGGDEEFYQTLYSDIGCSQREEVLIGLRDLVSFPEALELASEEEVLGTSLLRGTSLSVIKGQYRRILNGQAALTDYKFRYKRTQEDTFGGVALDFNVDAESKPSTNIHTIIGRNEVGKTTLLNGMIDAITGSNDSVGKFCGPPSLFDETQIGQDFFSSLISVSFSAFDTFIPPKEQPNPAEGTCYYYIGLKGYGEEGEELKSSSWLQNDFFESLKLIFQQKSKKRRWLKAIELLESDENFAELQLKELADISNGELSDVVGHKFSLMSVWTRDYNYNDNLIGDTYRRKSTSSFR